MHYDWQLLALLFVGVLITGISKSGFAGGVGVIAVPLISLRTSPAHAAALMLPLLLLMDALSVRAWWGRQLGSHLRMLLPPAILGILAGYFAFGNLSDEVIKIGLGGLSIMFGIWGLVKGAVKQLAFPPAVGMICGGIAGFTSFIAHAGGPPMSFYLINQKLIKEQFLATAVVFLAAVNFVKVVPYTLLGLFSVADMLPSLMMIPVAWLGVKLGVIVQQKINERYFFCVTFILLIFLGFRLITSTFYS